MFDCILMLQQNFINFQLNSYTNLLEYSVELRLLVYGQCQNLNLWLMGYNRCNTVSLFKVTRYQLCSLAVITLKQRLM